VLFSAVILSITPMGSHSGGRGRPAEALARRLSKAVTMVVERVSIIVGFSFL
jgi:hypothetical protein